MSDDRQQTSDEWDAMVKRKARQYQYQAPDSTPPAMTAYAQRAEQVASLCWHEIKEYKEVGYWWDQAKVRSIITAALAQAHAAGRREGLKRIAEPDQEPFMTTTDAIRALSATLKMLNAGRDIAQRLLTQLEAHRK